MFSIKSTILAITGIALSVPVMAQTVSSIAVSSTLTNVYRGQSATLSCTATLSTGGTEACPSPTYTESAGGSVIVLSGASFVGNAFGTTTVTATSSGQTGTLTINDIPPPQEPLGNITATQVKSGLGVNVTPTNAWEFALAKASGATQVRFQCGWSSVENQNAPPNNTQGSPAYSLTSSGCDVGLTNAATYGLAVDIVAAYGPPFHNILTVTVPGGAALGATTLNVTFSSGVGGDTLANLTPFFDNITNASGGLITNIGSYSGGLITAVSVSGSTATLTLASALSAALPAGSATYLINEGLYRPAANWSPTNASVEAYGNYAAYLASEIHAYGLTGQVELWNEPSWAGDPWDNILDFYDTPPAAPSPGPQTTYIPNYGFVAYLQTLTPPAGVTYNWGGTEKSGSNGLSNGTTGSDMDNETGTLLTLPPVTTTAQSMHPYGNNPEDQVWSLPIMQTTTGANDYYEANLFGVGPNASYGFQQSMLANNAHAGYGLTTNITETNFSGYLYSDATHYARFVTRHFLANLAEGVTNVNFYRLYENPDSDGFSLTNTSEAPLQPLTSLQGIESDAAIIGYSPPASYSSSTLTQVTSWGNLTGYPLDSLHIVGATSSTATQNSELMVLYQRTYTTTENWYSLTSPTAEPVTVTMPAGQGLVSATNLTTRAAVTTSVSGQNVTFSVADDPVELLIEPTPQTPMITLSGSIKLSGSASIAAQAASTLTPVTYASADTCDNFLGGSSTSVSCTTGTVTAGDALVIVSASGTAFTSFTDSLGGTITQLSGLPISWDSGGIIWQAYCLPNAAAGAHTITLAASAAVNYPGLAVLGFSGASTTNPCSSPVTTLGTNTATTSSGPVTTTLANSAVVGLAVSSATTFTAPGSGYTQVASPIAGFGLEYALEPSIGSYTPTLALSGTDYWVETAIVVNP
jgi:hypothetical protein